MKRIYFDYNATTPVDPRVAEAVSTALKNVYGNPSSGHGEGRAAMQLLEESREKVAGLINCRPDEIVFTGSGSESNNLAIKGVAEAFCGKPAHFITSKVEHPSVLNVFDYLEKKGFDITCLDVDRLGLPSSDALRSALRDDTVLVSIMMANNETGALLPVKELAAVAKERDVLFHTDAVQAVGKVPVDVKALDVDFLSLAGHKFYAPKGVGALYVRKGLKLEPLVHGGGQELGRRGGTENLPGISGLAEASEIAQANVTTEQNRLRELVSYLRESLAASFNVVFNNDENSSLPNTINAAFMGISGESLLMALDLEGIAISAGSACSSGALKASHVLSAMGLDEETIRGTVRISLGRWSSRDEADRLLELLGRIVPRLKKTGVQTGEQG